MRQTIAPLDSARDNEPGKSESESTITQVAREFGLTLRALRFYESRGLVVPRRDGAARLYGRIERERLKRVLRFKQLGFTLTEIGRLLQSPAAADPDELVLSRQQCIEQINLLERQKRDIEHALAELRSAYSRHYQNSLHRLQKAG